MRLSRGVLLVATALGCGGGDGVSPPPPPPSLGVATIEVTGATSVAAGGDVQLTATAKNAAGATMPGISFTWQSSAIGVATVSNTGLLHAVSAGAVSITARADGKTGTLPVVVRDNSALPPTLTGKIERVDLTIGPSQIVSITGNTAIVVDSTFLLEGTLEIAKGASLTLYGGKLLRITGILDGDSAAQYVIGGGRVEINGVAAAAASRLLAAERVRGALTPGGPIHLSAAFLVIQDALVKAGNGRAGTQEDRNGARGSSVEIGTALARARLATETGRDPPIPDGLLIDRSTVSGGFGGGGFHVITRAHGEVSGTTWTGRGGNGAKGGDVLISAAELDVRGSTVEPGPGGTGGGVALTLDEQLLDGSGPGGRGESGNVTTGNGGDGGDLVISVASVRSQVRFFQGDGQEGGSVHIQGGNGRAGGAGGNLVITVGKLGLHGATIVPPSLEVTEGRYSFQPRVSINNAANGGPADAAQEPGGAGGVIVISGPEGLPTELELLRFDRVANGGNGYDGCVDPRMNGTDGGPGGERDLAASLEEIEEVGRSFSGGNGGRGFPAAGTGGPRGLQRAGPGGAGPIGAPGAPGTLCPPQAAAERKVGIANFSSGLHVATAGATIQSGTAAVPPLAGAVSITRLESDPAIVILGTATNPGLVRARVSESGEVSFEQSVATAAPVHRVESAGQCVLAVQPGTLRSFGPTLTPVSALQVENLTDLTVSRTKALAHVGDQLKVFDINEATCEVTPNQFSSQLPTNTIDFALDLGVVGLLKLAQPTLIGPSTIEFTRLDAGGVPAGPSVTLQLSDRSFDAEFAPGGSFAYLMGNFGKVTTVGVDPLTPALSELGSFTLPGADRFEVVELTPEEELQVRSRSDRSFARVLATPVKIIYTKVSNVSLGQICSVLLGADGFPTEAPICEHNSTRPRPDSDLTVLRPAAPALKILPAFQESRRAPR